jgi:catechol-2,3-dioxygenase
MHLYETHLLVTDTKIAERFYREIVGLAFAYRDSTRDIISPLAGAKQKGMGTMNPLVPKIRDKI